MAHRGWKRDGFTPAKNAKALETLAWERATEGAPEKVIRGGEGVEEAPIEALRAHGIRVRAGQSAAREPEAGE